MNWMYQDPSKVDPEEYLLGRSVGKNFFKETSPVNYMRSIKDEPKSSHSRAELSRKMLEDPLTALKQKEDEQKRLLFQKLQLKQAGGVNLVPVIASSSEKKSPQSKSIEQLVIEQLKKLPVEIDLKKLHDDLKQKKKMKKLEKLEKEKASRKKSKKRHEGSRRKKRSKHSSSDSDCS